MLPSGIVYILAVQGGSYFDFVDKIPKCAELRGTNKLFSPL